MTNDQILNICEKYDNILIELGVDQALRETDVPGSLKHIRWMLTEIPKQISLGKSEKANRWLGFIQGVLWIKDIASIRELKDDNR